MSEKLETCYREMLRLFRLTNFEQKRDVPSVHYLFHDKDINVSFLFNSEKEAIKKKGKIVYPPGTKVTSYLQDLDSTEDAKKE